MIFSHVGIDEQRRRAAGWGKIPKRACRTEKEIADAVDVEHGPVGSHRIDDPLQLGDHRLRSAISLRNVLRTGRWWPWQIATAKASAESLLSMLTPGKRCDTII